MNNQEIIHPLYTANHHPGSLNVNPNWSYVPPVRPDFILNLDREESTSKPKINSEEADERRKKDFPIQVSNRYPSKLIEKKLAEEIAEHVGLKRENVLIGNGIMSMLTYIYETYTLKGQYVTVPTPSFWPAYSYALQRGRGIYMPQYKMVKNKSNNEFMFPFEDTIKYLKLGSPLCYICNPNNPTGTMVPYDYIEQLLKDFPGTLFILDEAYGEFAANKLNNNKYELTEGVNFIKSGYKNVAVVRTFSKVYAMANHRVGYLMSHESNVETLRAHMGPYDMNELALAMALYNYRERGYVENVIRTVVKNMKVYTDLLSQLSVEYFDGFRNSILVEGLELGVKYEENGIAVRSMVYQEGIPNIIKSTFRITIPSEQEGLEFLFDITKKII